MTVETRAPTDLQDHLTEAAAAAIADVMPAIERAGPRLHTLTVEIELDTRGRVAGAVVCTQLRVNLGKLLGVGRV